MVVDPGRHPRAAPENADHASRQREVHANQREAQGTKKQAEKE
jgi:hypothetical protein